MVTTEIALTPMGAAMLVSTSAEDCVACPHCGVGIVLKTIDSQPGSLAVQCPHCEGRSLLVRLVSVFHRAVRLSGELLAQLRGEPSAQRAPPGSVRMPEQVYEQPVSRGALVLLTMMWRRAERENSMTIEASVSRLAQRLLSTRSVVRRWLGELEEAGAVRERLDCGKRRRPRQWELLPLAGKEGRDD